MTPTMSTTSTPTVAARRQPRVFGFLDPFHGGPVQQEYYRHGWLGVYARWGIDLIGSGMIPVLRFVKPGGGDIPVAPKDINAILSHSQGIIAYSRMPRNVQELCMLHSRWFMNGGRLWFDAAAGLFDPLAYAFRNHFANSSKPAFYEFGVEPWPDINDKAAGMSGCVIIQDTEWQEFTTEKPWPPNWKPRDFQPPGGIVRWWDHVLTDPAREFAAAYADCAATGHDLCFPGDVLLNPAYGIKLNFEMQPPSVWSPL